MATFVGLLRAVNVGGRKLSMPDLVRLTEAAGGRDVRTYLQSGNVVFDATREAADSLSKAVSSACGFDVPILLRTPADLGRLVAAQPMSAADSELHVTFLEGKPKAAAIRAIDPTAYGVDSFVVAGREVYLRCPSGYGRSKLNNAFWERKLGLVATTRNWRTVLQLHEMSSTTK